MKKNKTMRAASALLVAVLLTTSVVSGTFAKYTTSADASDTARVAKWGVEVTTSGSLFEETYTSTNGTTVEVASKDNVKQSVVAPGTANKDGITFSITGTPEVMVDVDIAVTNADGKNEHPVDIFLMPGTYADLTTGTSNVTEGGETSTTYAADTFFAAATYYPVKFSLVQTKQDGTEKLLVDAGTLASVETALEGLSNANQEVAANTDLGTVFGTFKLTWEWPFENEEEYASKADTLLGDLAADSMLKVRWVDTKFYPAAPNDHYCNDLSFKLAITVEQID